MGLSDWTHWLNRPPVGAAAGCDLFALVSRKITYDLHCRSLITLCRSAERLVFSQVAHRPKSLDGRRRYLSSRTANSAYPDRLRRRSIRFCYGGSRGRERDRSPGRRFAGGSKVAEASTDLHRHGEGFCATGRGGADRLRCVLVVAGLCLSDIWHRYRGFPSVRSGTTRQFAAQASTGGGQWCDELCRQPGRCAVSRDAGCIHHFLGSGLGHFDRWSHILLRRHLHGDVAQCGVP
ncbi:hypothetical protein D3C72_688610 [compost metagenome]